MYIVLLRKMHNYLFSKDSPVSNVVHKIHTLETQPKFTSLPQVAFFHDSDLLKKIRRLEWLPRKCTPRWTCLQMVPTAHWCLSTATPAAPTDLQYIFISSLAWVVQSFPQLPSSVDGDRYYIATQRDLLAHDNWPLSGHFCAQVSTSPLFKNRHLEGTETSAFRESAMQNPRLGESDVKSRARNRLFPQFFEIDLLLYWLELMN